MSKYNVSIENFRDLGGIVCQDGRVVKDNLLFRSGALNQVSAEDKVELEKLGIKHIFDFRSDRETNFAPDYVPQGTNYYHIPASTSRGRMVVNPKDVAKMVPKWASPKFCIKVFLWKFKGMYRKFPFKNKAYAKMFEVMDSGDSFLVHCSAGKDRTGVACMLILFALGADYQTIEQDYLYSNICRVEANKQYTKQFEGFKHYNTLKAVFDVALNVSPQLLKCSYNQIIKKYGDVKTYFLKEYNITDERISKWKEYYTTKA